MRVLIAADKFKDSLTAPEACEVVAAALKRVRPDWIADLCPLTDGGEGFSRILTDSANGDWISQTVTGPRGLPVEAGFGMIDISRLPVAVAQRLGCSGRSCGKLAVIEMATASGLALLQPQDRDVWRTQTRGTGELIAAAADREVAGILLGVGGSATHDLGLGALSALGLGLYTATGKKIADAAPHKWAEVTRINADKLHVLPPLWIACDVTNPLLGPRGAAYTYATQKGLRPETLPRLESQTAQMAEILLKSTINNEPPQENGDGIDVPRPISLAQTAGAGAAGGIAFGLMAVAGARLISGSDLVADWLMIRSRLTRADILITGEGCFDQSSACGKGPGALIKIAISLGRPAHVFAGRIDAAETPGLRLYEISPRETPLTTALKNTACWLDSHVAAAFTPETELVHST